MAIARTAFGRWKAERELTDEQIAEQVRARGVPCSRQMIGALLSGDRRAGGKLAIVLADLTSLPVALFVADVTEEPPAVASPPLREEPRVELDPVEPFGA